MKYDTQPIADLMDENIEKLKKLVVMKTILRIEIFNISLKQWDIIHENEFNGWQIEVTPQELIDLIGFGGGMFITEKTNEQENKFIEEFYKIGNELNK